MVTAALNDLVAAVKVFPDNAKVSRSQLEANVTSATTTLQAVIDLFEPPVPIDSQRALALHTPVDLQRMSTLLAPVELQRVSDSVTSDITTEPSHAPPTLSTNRFHSNDSIQRLPLKTRGRPKGNIKVDSTTLPSPPMQHVCQIVLLYHCGRPVN